VLCQSFEPGERHKPLEATDTARTMIRKLRVARNQPLEHVVHLDELTTDEQNAGLIAADDAEAGLAHAPSTVA
jgi:hypothetical protein